MSSKRNIVQLFLPEIKFRSIKHSGYNTNCRRRQRQHFYQPGLRSFHQPCDDEADLTFNRSFFWFMFLLPSVAILQPVKNTYSQPSTKLFRGILSRTSIIHQKLLLAEIDQSRLWKPKKRGFHYRQRGGNNTNSMWTETRTWGWVPVRTEEEERRLSNSEKSSLEVPLEALNRSKLPGRGKRRQTDIKHKDRWNQTAHVWMTGRRSCFILESHSLLWWHH